MVAVGGTNERLSQPSPQSIYSHDPPSLLNINITKISTAAPATVLTKAVKFDNLLQSKFKQDRLGMSVHDTFLVFYELLSID